MEMKWSFVLQCLHDRGKTHGLTRNQFVKAYLLCDGCGKIDENYAQYWLKWDWNHVKNSSTRAIEHVYQYLLQHGFHPIQEPFPQKTSQKGSQTICF